MSGCFGEFVGSSFCGINFSGLCGEYKVWF